MTVMQIKPAEGESHGDGEQNRLDRELIELLNELRVVLPGVQALFGFLLIVPFNDRFNGVSEYLRDVYFVALMASAIACVLFVTPPCFHRLRFRRHDKDELLRVGNRCAIAGCMALGVAMVASVLLVADFLFDGRSAAVLTGVIALCIAVLWWAVPLGFRRGREPDGS